MTRYKNCKLLLVYAAQEHYNEQKSYFKVNFCNFNCFFLGISVLKGSNRCIEQFRECTFVYSHSISEL